MCLEHQHRIHTLINEQNYLFYKHFNHDIDQAIADKKEPPSVEALIEKSKELEKQIMELSN